MRLESARLLRLVTLLLLVVGIPTAASAALPPGVTGVHSETRQRVLREVAVAVFVDGHDFQMIHSTSPLTCVARGPSPLARGRGIARVFGQGPGGGVVCDFGFLSAGSWNVFVPVSLSTGFLEYEGTITVNPWSLTAPRDPKVRADRVDKLLANPDLQPEQRERLETLGAELDEIEQEVQAAYAVAPDATSDTPREAAPDAGPTADVAAGGAPR
jgi:hypothetical protein